MSTPLTDRIEALTAQANAVTGASDTTLTDAVGRLIGGYENGIDVTFTDGFPKQGSDAFTNYLFSAVNGEFGKPYVAILKNANDPNLHHLLLCLAFFKPSASSAVLGGGVRQNVSASGTSYSSIIISSSWDAQASAGDIYTVYTP